jgi:hypothetical protein
VVDINTQQARHIARRSGQLSFGASGSWTVVSLSTAFAFRLLIDSMLIVDPAQRPDIDKASIKVVHPY